MSMFVFVLGALQRVRKKERHEKKKIALREKQK